MRRHVPLACLLAGLALGAAACAGSGEPDLSTPTSPPPTEPAAAREEAPAAILRVAVVGITSLDPVQPGAPGPSRSLVSDLLFDGLTRFDPRSGTVAPSLAEEWTVADDGTVWTFVLDPDARFSDRSPVTAADVKASLERVARLGFTSVAGARLGVVQGVAELAAGRAEEASGLVVRSPRVLEIHLVAPFAPLAELLADPIFGIVPPGGVDEERPVGSGPFVVSYRDEERIVAEAAPGRHGGLDGIELVVVPDGQAASAALRSGQVDVAPVPAEHLDAAREAGASLVSTDYQATAFYGMNVGHPALADVRMRHAVVRAVDRDALRERFFGEGAVTLEGLVTAGVAGHRVEACGDLCAFDPEAARALVAQTHPDGEVPAVPVDFFVDDRGQEAAMAQAVVESLVAVGIPAEARGHDEESFREVLLRGQAGLFRFGWVASYPSADASLGSLFASDGVDNVFSLSDEELDAHLEAAWAELGAEDRTERFLAAEDRIFVLAPMVPVARYRIHVAVAPRVEGIVVGPSGAVDLSAATLVAS